ncbi:hypothetical protein G5I_07934 [Acromyrmex echinatior]|uniref:Uncharacterized protein n=1 Tax=Acromyrmex echinatior TaxID=103372 RepID=F4WQ74_ACREC|nr:hypothetical protein G5I_07934 [Acromyrmex echinatior]
MKSAGWTSGEVEIEGASKILRVMGDERKRRQEKEEKEEKRWGWWCGKVTSIAMLQTLSHFFAAKCPEGWRGAEVCYRAQRRRIEEKCTDTVYQQGTALKYGSRGLVNSVLGFHVVRRGFSAPWGCSKNYSYKNYSVEERKNGQKKERGKGIEKETEKAKGRRKRERLSVIARRKEARNRKKRAPKPLRSGSACRTTARPTSSRRLEIAAKWKALAKRYRVGANTKGKAFVSERQAKKRWGEGCGATETLGLGTSAVQLAINVTSPNHGSWTPLEGCILNQVPFGTPARPKLNEIIKLHIRRKPLITLQNLDQLVNNVLGSITDEGSFPAYVRGIAGYTLDVKPAWK